MECRLKAVTPGRTNSALLNNARVEKQYRLLHACQSHPHHACNRDFQLVKKFSTLYNNAVQCPQICGRLHAAWRLTKLGYDLFKNFYKINSTRNKLTQNRTLQKRFRFKSLRELIMCPHKISLKIGIS